MADDDLPFTLGEFMADIYNPHRGDEAGTRNMLTKLGVPFVDSVEVRPDGPARLARVAVAEMRKVLENPWEPVVTRG